MADFLTTLRSQVLLTDGAMGSYLFELTGRLSEANHVYEDFNRERPELIQQIHRAYLTAGARCLKTNTFGANRAALRQFGLDGRLVELNRAGVALARQAINEHAGKGDVFVLASIGPAEDADVTACYREQIETVIAAGADALLLETFTSVPELEKLLDLIRSVPAPPPVITGMTYNPDVQPHEFIQRMAAKGAAVVGVNCCAPWDARTFVEAAQGTPVPLSVMPNAGGFQRIGNRFMSSVNPEFMGRMARQFLDAGVRLIGGCCEVHPPHIREMNNYLHSRAAGTSVVSFPVGSTLAPVGTPEKRGNGRLSRKLTDGEFAVSVEVVPPRGTAREPMQTKVEFVRQLAESGLVDAVDVTDGSRGIPLMPPGDFIQRLRQELGWTQGDRLELIPHFAARDLNVMGIQSRLIGYHATGIHNVLFITGDPPKMSPTYPRSTAVFDLDSVGMIQLTHGCLNAGVDFGGAPLGKQADPRTHFTIGTGFEPEAVDQKRELDRLRRKLDAGADYIMTQPAFTHEPLAMIEPYRQRGAFLVGVMLLANLSHAQRMAEVPGVHLPARILDRLATGNTPADQAKIGLEIAAEQIRWLRQEGWPGVYLMSPGIAAGVLSVLRAGLS